MKHTTDKGGSINTFIPFRGSVTSASNIVIRASPQLQGFVKAVNSVGESARSISLNRESKTEK